MMTNPKPRPRQYRTVSQGTVYAFVFLAVLALVIALTGFLWTAAEVRDANTRAQALCKFDADIGTVPVQAAADTRKASVLGVSIVSDARVAFRLAACPGQLGKPDPSFVHWANFYHLPTG